MKFINIGFGNMVAAERVVALVSPDSAPIKRLIQDAKDASRTIDVSCGRKTRSVIIIKQYICSGNCCKYSSHFNVCN